jgi:hypothetical protein
MSKSIESGDIYFFYRPKVDFDKIRGMGDVQRFHLVMVPDKATKARLFVVGKKRLPEVAEGRAQSTEREWMMNSMTAKPGDVGKALGPVTYDTSTEGEQVQGEAIPAGEGRYAIFERKGDTRLAYRLFRPRKPGNAQKALGILPEATFIVTVKNPTLGGPGFPQEKPEYPKKLREMFGDKRWIDLNDTRLLEYENAQLLLIGAHASLEQTDIEISGQPDVFATLGIEPREWATETVEEGRFTEPKMEAPAIEPRGDPTKGGKKAAKSDSAAGIAAALKGMEFPANRSDLVRHAKEQRAGEDIVSALNGLPSHKFKTMADVQKALSKVR